MRALRKVRMASSVMSACAFEFVEEEMMTTERRCWRHAACKDQCRPETGVSRIQGVKKNQ